MISVENQPAFCCGCYCQFHGSNPRSGLFSTFSDSHIQKDRKTISTGFFETEGQSATHRFPDLVAVYYLMILFLGIVGSTCANAQTTGPDLMGIMESLVPVPDEETSYDDLYDHFLEMRNRPMNLNEISPADLQSTFILSQAEIEAILDYRERSGDFLSVFELYHLGLDSAKVTLLIPFVTVTSTRDMPDTTGLLNRIRKMSKNSMILRYASQIEPRLGFRNRSDPEALLAQRYYLGSPIAIYGRLALSIPEYCKIGLTFEKDPGEVFFFNPSLNYYGFDHLAGHIQLMNRGILKNLVVGDFTFQAGQGLIAGNNFFMGKGSESVSTVKRFDGGLRAYQGATESGYFHGLGISVGSHQWEISGFVSAGKADAILAGDPVDSTRTVITSLPETGYHRTPLEISRRSNIVEFSAGFKAAYFSKYKNFTAGLAGMLNHYNYPVRRKATYYNQFEFTGTTARDFSVYYDYFKRKIDVFGEFAWSGKGGGFVQGIMMNINEYVEMAIHLRYYDKEFIALHGNAFGEYHGNNNEEGVYAGIKIHPAPHLQLYSFYDYHQSPWLRYRIASPSAGDELLAKATYRLHYGMVISLTYRQEKKYRNLPKGDNPEYTVGQGKKRNIYLDFQFDKGTGIHFDTRLQGCRFEFSGNNPAGYALIQDIGYHFKFLELDARLAFFNAADYDTRQFAYEKDLLYYFSVPAYYGSGFRLYGLVHWRITDQLKIWFKAAQFIYLDREESGSGLDLIDGNKKTEIRCQVQIKF